MFIIQCSVIHAMPCLMQGSKLGLCCWGSRNSCSGSGFVFSVLVGLGFARGPGGRYCCNTCVRGGSTCVRGWARHPALRDGMMAPTIKIGARSGQDNEARVLMLACSVVL